MVTQPQHAEGPVIPVAFNRWRTAKKQRSSKFTINVIARFIHVCLQLNNRFLIRRSCAIEFRLSERDLDEIQLHSVA